MSLRALVMLMHSLANNSTLLNYKSTSYCTYSYKRTARGVALVS
jgi:hypothetical protein